MRLGLDDMADDEMMEAIEALPFAEKQEALRQELGMTEKESYWFLIDMGEQPDLPDPGGGDNDERASSSRHDSRDRR